MNIFKIIGIAAVANWVIGFVSLLWRLWVEDETLEKGEFNAVLIISCFGILLPISFFLNRRKKKF